MQGVGRFAWNPTLSSELGHTHYKWRLTDTCVNPYCPEYQLPLIDKGQRHGDVDAINYFNESECLAAELDPLLRHPVASDIFRVAGEHYFKSFIRHIREYFKLGVRNDLTETMRYSDAVISGSCALLALRPATFMPNDLDFYISTFSDCEPLRYLLSTNQYALVLETDDTYRNRYSSRLIDRVELFHHENEPRSIHIIYTSSRSALAPIIDFDTTILMNFVSADNIVSLYPIHVTHNMGKRLNKSSRSLELFSKYNQRGFRLMAQLLWERENATYDWKSIPNSTMLVVPPNIKLSANLSNISWILPFVPADDVEQHEEGFWFEEIDDFG